MTLTRTPTRLLFAVLGTLALGAGACSSDDDSTSTTSVAGSTVDTTAESVAPTDVPDTTLSPYTGVLAGNLGIDAGACDGTAVTGSYFRMQQPDGNFIPNADSACADTTYSLLTPGTDGGLLLGDFQPAPDPAFDGAGNGLAEGVAMPVKFFGVSFAIATDPSGTAPSLTESGGILVGDLSAFTAYYGGGVFNQGSPKADGSAANLTGTIDAVTGHYVIEWTSLISGGSFDGFTGVWHLEGTFSPMG